jgi:hypothetical protein
LDTPRVLAAPAPSHSPQQVVKDFIKKLEYSISSLQIELSGLRLPSSMTLKWHELTKVYT